MNKQEILSRLTQSYDDIRRRFAVKTLSVFGSLARGEASLHSDVDILVSFKDRATFDKFMDLKFYLEDVLETRVDLVTENALRPVMRKAIEKEMIHVS